jgi:hypothetical protein
MNVEYPRTLKLDQAEAWNLLEIYEETVRSGDYETIDTLEQKLIDAVYGTPDEQGVATPTECDCGYLPSDDDDHQTHRAFCLEARTCCDTTHLIIDGGVREDTT